MTAFLQERFVEAGGGRIRYLAAGAGEPTLALWPGLGGTGEAFLRLLREGPERGCRIVALDPPGHGRSSRMPLGGGADAAAIFTAVLDDAGAEAAVIGGHSYGAVAALAGLAASPPLSARVQGLLLYDGGYLSADVTEKDPRESCEQHISGFTFATWEELFAAGRAAAKRWDEDLEAAARAAMVERDGRIRLRVDVETCTQAIHFVDASAPAKLPPLGTGRALLLRAGQPPEMEEERARGVLALHEKIPALEVQVLSGVTHELLEEEPESVAQATWAFLRSL